MSFLDFLKSAKKFIDSYAEKIETPRVVVISNSEDKVSEISYFLTSRKDESFSYISFVMLESLDVKLYEKIRDADAVIIYSTNPLDELVNVAFACSIVSQITFRYLVLLSSKDAKMATEILATRIRINPCRLHSFGVRNELLSALPSLLIETLPVECLPYYLKMPGFEEIRRKRAAIISAINIAKGLIVMRLIPGLGLPISLELIRAGIRIASVGETAKSAQRILPYFGALIFGHLTARRRIVKNSARFRPLPGISKLVFLIVILILGAFLGVSEE